MRLQHEGDRPNDGKRRQAVTVTFRPSSQSVSVPLGATLREAAEAAGVDVDSPCGGLGLCGKCMVRVTGAVEPPTDEEAQFLLPEEIEGGTRLACRVRVAGDVEAEVLRLAESDLHKILVSGMMPEADLEFEPPCKKFMVGDLGETLHETRTSDVEVLVAACDGAIETRSFNLELVRSLPERLRSGTELSVVHSERDVLGLTDATSRIFGVAVDIGTTTVVGSLLDLETGREVAIASRLNAQNVFGADTISRINFCSTDDAGLSKLHGKIMATLNEIVGELLQRTGAAADDVWEVVLVGNATMVHLFLGILPKHLALAPYAPVVRAPAHVTAGELGLKVNQRARLRTVPCIGSFVGADSVGVILSSGLHKADKVKLAIDIGTNGEVMLGSRERMLACSTAAGPAFEGAELSCGMRAAQGAIEKVRFDGDGVHIKTIADAKPIGICGSGVVDVVAGLLELGVIEPSGRIVTDAGTTKHLPGDIQQRIVDNNGEPAFVLYEDESQRLMFTQRDVRQVQLAKGAIRAGIECLKSLLGVSNEAIDKVYLAGAFGNYINPHNAIRIGVMPPFPISKVRAVGNAAGVGAKLVLLSQRARDEAREIAATTEHIELADLRSFQDHYMEAMLFPEG